MSTPETNPNPESTQSRPPGTDAVLLQPPPGDLTGPYPALAYLKSHAQQEGFNVRVMDLGIDALYFLSQKETTRFLLDQAANLRTRMEQRPSLGFGERQWYKLLIKADGFSLKPGIINEAIEGFKDPKQFYDYFSYKKNRAALEAFYDLLSGIYYPTQISPANYPAARGMKSMENIFAHAQKEVNPYVLFYEKTLFSELARLQPAVVGISMVFASQSVNAIALARLIKQRFPKIHVTMGGAYLSQWVMMMDPPVLNDLFACTDSVICGEAEEPFAELLRRIRDNKPLAGTPNLVCAGTTENESGKKNEIGLSWFKQMTYTDIARQPAPDFSDLDMKKYLIPEPVIPYAISRGCYWGKCVFCQNRYGDHGVRAYQTLPVEKALAKMTRLSEKYDTRHFNFSNDVIDPKYLKQFSEAVLQTGKTFYWNTDLRAEKKFTPQLCRLMAKAGLNCVAIGFESGCQKVLDAMNKGNVAKTTREVLKSLHDAGVATQAMGFFGFPTETEADGMETVSFLENHVDRISYYVMGLLMVVPGSRMYKEPEKYGVSGISYKGNPLKTPEPVWFSKTRMPPDAVNRIYQRLATFEAVYAIDEYPYVGALSTNHGFLYFRLGPDVLKLLRKHEKDRNHRLYHLLVPRSHQHHGGIPSRCKPEKSVPETHHAL